MPVNLKAAKSYYKYLYYNTEIILKYIYTRHHKVTEKQRIDKIRTVRHFGKLSDKIKKNTV